jgi:hypothetical protein
MPVDKEALDSSARRYASAMTSIRGRRVHRLLMREFSRFDLVVPAVAENGAGVLLALTEGGGVAMCQTHGRGAVVDIAECSCLEGVTVKTSYDFTKDSLPIVSWTIWHPSFARETGALTIDGTDLSNTDLVRIAGIVRRLGLKP